MAAKIPEPTWTLMPRPALRRWRIYFRILRQWLRRPQFRRDRRIVQERYQTVWRESPASVRTTAPKRTIREHRGALYEVPKAAMRKAHLAEMSEALGRFGHIGSVLELGCGNGINLFAFAALHPEIKTWRGVELTAEGIRAAERMRKDPPLADLAYLTDLPQEAIAERLAAADIAFQQGSILDLPFSDESFDEVFSRLAIEQLPRDYPLAFAEACRVARVGGFFLEEFREAQQNVFQRMQLKNLDYFRASYREAARAGWRIVRFSRMPMNKIQFSFGLLVCSKEPARGQRLSTA